MKCFSIFIIANYLFLIFITVSCKKHNQILNSFVTKYIEDDGEYGGVYDNMFQAPQKECLATENQTTTSNPVPKLLSKLRKNANNILEIIKELEGVLGLNGEKLNTNSQSNLPTDDTQPQPEMNSTTIPDPTNPDFNNPTSKPEPDKTIPDLSTPEKLPAGGKVNDLMDWAKQIHFCKSMLDKATELFHNNNGTTRLAATQITGVDAMNQKSQQNFTPPYTYTKYAKRKLTNRFKKRRYNSRYTNNNNPKEDVHVKNRAYDPESTDHNYIAAAGREIINGDIPSKTWSEWTGWSPCSNGCGAGKKIRFRKCIGTNCASDLEMDEEDCVSFNCKPDQ